MCTTHEHDFVLGKTGYLKASKNYTAGYDQSMSYATIYCRKCGYAKEIIWADYRSQNTSITENAFPVEAVDVSAIGGEKE